MNLNNMELVLWQQINLASDNEMCFSLLERDERLYNCERLPKASVMTRNKCAFRLKLANKLRYLADCLYPQQMEGQVKNC